jgi:hypothetical protein
MPNSLLVVSTSCLALLPDKNGPAYIKSDGVNVIATNHMATASELPHPSTEDERKNTLYCIYQNIPSNQHYIWLKPK